MLPDYLIEVRPIKPYGGDIVWEWHIWDHLIKDYDPNKNNYGVVANHPELVDVNGVGGARIPQFWNHVNGIDYNAQFDQIIMSVRGNSELFVIDHGVTTAQASGHSGGRYNKGGDLLYRWGNPQQYDRGAGASRKFYQQHHTRWIETGLPGAGNILIFNNGIGRNYSSVDEIAPPVDAAGNYSLSSGAAFGPDSLTWTYVSTPPSDFYSSEISGSQRLPNGNTLICSGISGTLFEVTTGSEIVWKYINPVVTTGPLTQGNPIPADQARAGQFMNAVFRVERYAPDYSGLQGKDLTPLGTIEIYPSLPTPVTSVSAASFEGAEMASESIVSAFGTELATATAEATTSPLPTSLAGTTIKIKDSIGAERLAPLFFVSPGQANFWLPAGTVTGAAGITVINGNGTISTGTAIIATVAPGLFACNANGRGVAAALALRVKADGSFGYEDIARLDTAQGKFVSIPIDLGPESDQVYLVLFGTGFRFRSSLSGVTVRIGGVDAQITYAGAAPDYFGLDQINARLSRSLIGRGEIDVTLTVDGKSANTVGINIK